MNKKFFKQYFNNQINLLNFDDEVLSKLEKVKKYLKLVSQN